jgi:hypothetical protein
MVYSKSWRALSVQISELGAIPRILHYGLWLEAPALL